MENRAHTEPSIDEGGPGARRRRGGCEERTPLNSYASTQLRASDARRMFVLYATPYKSLGQRKEEGAPLRRTVGNMGARGKKGPPGRSSMLLRCVHRSCEKKECVDGSDVIFPPPLFLLPVGNHKAHGWLMTFFTPSHPLLLRLNLPPLFLPFFPMGIRF